MIMRELTVYRIHETRKFLPEKSPLCMNDICVTPDITTNLGGPQAACARHWALESYARMVRR